MSTLLLVPSKDLSCKIFREYPAGRIILTLEKLGRKKYV